LDIFAAKLVFVGGQLLLEHLMALGHAASMALETEFSIT
jgi:hypothetical protein